MKQIILLMMLLASMCLQAKQTVLTTYFSVECEAQWGTDTIMIEDDNTITYTITLQNALGVYVRWNAYGDIVLTNQTATSATFYSKGPAKGRISYIYDPASDDPCQFTRNAFIDIYKHFDAEEKYGLTIVGPDCIADGDSVVYSIKPILTTSVNSGIGIDLYNWNIFDATSDPYVQNVSYVSGDSSSVTFKAGTMTGRDSITVRVGLANEEYRLVKHLGKKVPKPLVDPICIVQGQRNVQMQVTNPLSNVTYEWSCSDDMWQIDVDPNNSAIAYISPNDIASANIIVTAYYTGSEECGSDVTIVKVDRKWLDNAYIDTVTNYPYAYNTTYEFNLIGGAGGDLTWINPAGWEKVSSSSLNYKMKPVNAAKLQLVDTLYVTAESLCAIESQVAKIPIYMKPAKVLSIGTTSCLAADVPHTFTIDELETGPVSTAYEWKIYKGNTLYDTQVGTNTFTTTLSSDMTRIDVRPIGATNNNTTYYGETAQFPITFSPITPTSIESSKECIAFHMPDEVTLTLTGTVPTQSYEWEVPADLDTVNLDSRKTSIKIFTDGRDTTYTIKAWAADDGTCGSSDTVRTNVNIVATSSYIHFVNMDIGVTTIVGYIISPQSNYGSITSRDWYFFDNGVIIDSLDSSTGVMVQLKEPYPVYQDIINYPLYGIGCVVTYSNGCKEFIRHGNVPDLSTIELVHPPKTQSASSRKNLKTGEMIIYPNPVKEELTIDLTDSKQPSTLYIISNTGQLVSSVKNFVPGSSYNVSSLKQGAYIICILQDENKYVKSFIKQ